MAGNPLLSLQESLNIKLGAPNPRYYTLQVAANKLAGTTGYSVCDALCVYAGQPPQSMDIQEALNKKINAPNLRYYDAQVAASML